MPVTDYHHGVRVQEVTEGSRSFRTIATGVIGMVSIASDADADAFPLNTPVLVTDWSSKISKAGDEDHLAPSMQAIIDQTDPVGVIVRVAEGADDAATTANVIAGVQKLRQAESLLGVKPRIIGAPGLDVQTAASALATEAQKLNGFAYAGCGPSDTVSEAITYRENFSQRELMLIYPDFKFGTASGYATARALGLRAKIDEEIGWHKTISNVGVNGVTGISLPVTWNLQDSDTDAGLLNAGDVTTLIRRNGFRFWGSRTCSDEPLFAFESAVRTAQVLKDTIAEGLMWAVDKPLHPTLAKDIIESIRGMFRTLVAQGYLIGADAWLNTELNTTSNLREGRLIIDYDYTPVPPLENLYLQQKITDRYFANFAERVGA